MTLTSMSLTAPTTPVLPSETAEEVQDLTGSDKGVVTGAEIIAGAHTTDMTKKNKDSERKRKERSGAPSGTVNWSSSDDVRMIFVACCPEIQKLFELRSCLCQAG
jgi:hypothetical protein